MKSILSRLFIVGISTLCILVLMAITDRLVAKIEPPWPNANVLLSHFPAVFLASIAIWAWPGLRPGSSPGFRWSWVNLVPLGFLAMKAAHFEIPNRGLLASASFVIGMLFVGIKEEVFFRGFCFLRGGELTPRTTVLASSVAFSLVHLYNLSDGQPLARVVVDCLIAMTLGIAFGIVRITTGGLFWPILLHFLIDAFSEFSSAWRFEFRFKTIPAFDFYASPAVWLFAAGAVAAWALLVLHPRMRARSLSRRVGSP